MTQTSVNVKRRRSTDLLKHISEALLLFLADGWVAPTTVSAPHYLKMFIKLVSCFVSSQMHPARVNTLQKMSSQKNLKQ